MGTHPIFESDFDCLTGQTRFVLTNSLKCVTSLPIFSLNSVATKPQMLMPSRPSFPALVLMLTRRNCARSSPSSLARTLMMSSPKVKKSSPPSHQVVEPPQPPPLVVPLPPRRHQRKKQRRNPSLKTMTWVSTFSVNSRSSMAGASASRVSIVPVDLLRFDSDDTTSEASV